MSKLRTQSCEWAVQHLKNYGDTDLFPKPFELNVITSYSDSCIKLLQKMDVGAYTWQAGRKTIVPKDVFTFRSAVQLDPLDTLFLSALMYEIGLLIEKQRLPIEKEIVFSYRFRPLSNGILYAEEPNWTTFWRTSLEKAKSNGGWVLITDISNFYQQIYHHSVENELNEAKVPKEFISSIMNLLKHLTQSVSRGIPVGPHAIHLLAEISLHSTDKSILSKGHEFCRYVDDIHVFCKTKEEARIALFDLAETLDAQQRLAIQSHKTSLVPAADFIQYAQQMLFEKPLTDIEKDFVSLVQRYSSGDPYSPIRIVDLTPQEKEVLSKQNIKKLLDAYILAKEPNYAHIRWIFRRLKQIGSPTAISYAIEHLEELIPAWGSIGNYILSASLDFSEDWKPLGDGLMSALKMPLVQHSEYLTVLLLNLYAQLPVLNHVDEILQMYPNRSPMVRRKIVRVATSGRAGYWLREQKERLPESDPWLKRALIAGASALPRDERDFWLKQVKRNGNEFEKLIAQWTSE